MCYTKIGGESMSDFAYAYFNTELEKLDVPALEEIFEKVKALLNQKRTSLSEQGIDVDEVERINAVYTKIPKAVGLGKK